MFKVTKEPKFTHDVTVQVPVNGGKREETFKATFKVVDMDAIGDTFGSEGQEALLKRVLCDMSDLEDEAGNPMDYSDEIRDQLIKIPYVRAGLLNTYMSAINGAKAGN